MRRFLVVAALAVAWITLSAPSPAALDARHVVVYREAGRFGGWPANHGMWSWGDEMLVGFSAGYYKDNGPKYHAIDHDKPEEHLLARSLDGGRTWRIENPASKGALLPRGDALHGTELPRVVMRPLTDCPGGIDFAHRDFAMTVRMPSNHGGQSRFFYSTDRGHHWNGPFKFPMLGLKGIAARTDYIVNGPSDCTVFLTASKSNGREGRPFCARTADGGKTWAFVGWIGPEPAGYAIMPSSVRLTESGGLLSAIRVRDGDESWIDAYFSPDDGVHWKKRSTPVPDTGEGNPAAMLRLSDGRICVTYGVRAEPFGIRARLSGDEGRTWGRQIILRDDGGGRDLGYPRSVQRPDGKVVTVYYFYHHHKGPRTIGATIWDPSQINR